MRRGLAIVMLLSTAIAAAADAPETAPTIAGKFYIRPVALFFEHLYEGSFSSPMGIWFDEKAREVWVADTKNNLIGVFNPDGAPLFTFGSDRLRQPVRVVTGPKGHVYVLDSERSKIKVFSYRGDALGDLTLPGVGDNPIYGTMAFDGDGNFYVGENDSCQVLVYGPEFKPRQRFGTCGSDEGQFQAITGIAVDKERIVVTDAQVLAVQVFDKHGDFLRGWGHHDMGIQNFSLPASVAVDSLGHVVVLDTLRHEIKFFDAEGTFLARFGGLGSRIGQEAYPSGIVIDASDRLYVVEKGNQRVQVFIEVAGDFPPDTQGLNRNNGPKGPQMEGKEVPRISPSSGSNPGSSLGSSQQPLGGKR